MSTELITLKPSWRELHPENKVASIKSVWGHGSSASKIARDLRPIIRGALPSRQAIIGVYTRNTDLRVSHPLDGRAGYAS